MIFSTSIASLRNSEVEFSEINFLIDIIQYLEISSSDFFSKIFFFHLYFSKRLESTEFLTVCCVLAKKFFNYIWYFYCLSANIFL